jgi:hypothetical protein
VYASPSPTQADQTEAAAKGKTAVHLCRRLERRAGHNRPRQRVMAPQDDAHTAFVLKAGAHSLARTILHAPTLPPSV